MGTQLLSYSPRLLVHCEFTATHYFGTETGYYDVGGGSIFYRGTLLDIPAIMESMSDLYYGVEQSSQVTLRFANHDNGIDDTWHDIVTSEDIRNCWVRIYKYDPTDGATAVYAGKIVEWDVREEAEITLEMRDDTLLDTVLPRLVVGTDIFADAPDRDIGRPINLCFGSCRNVPLSLINNDTTNNYYDYLIGYGVIEGIWSDSTHGVRRNGVLVDSSEYTVYDGSQGSPHAGYAFIRFTAEQLDFGGNFYQLTADVYGLELGGSSRDRNFANVIKYILSNATWGLGDSIDSTTFTAAASALTSFGNMYCDGAVTSEERARDILDELLMVCRGSLIRGIDGEWELTVDLTYDSTVDDYFGFNDNQYGGIVEVLRRTNTPVAQAPGTITARYALDGLSEEEYRKKEITVTSYGTDRSFDLRFVRTNVTTDRFLSYLYNRSIYGDDRLSIKIDMRGRDRRRGDIIYINIPSFGIAGAYKIESITKTLTEFTVELYEYSSSIYTVETIADPADPEEIRPDDNLIDWDFIDHFNAGVNLPTSGALNMDFGVWGVADANDMLETVQFQWNYTPPTGITPDGFAIGFHWNETQISSTVSSITASGTDAYGRTTYDIVIADSPVTKGFRDPADPGNRVAMGALVIKHTGSSPEWVSYTGMNDGLKKFTGCLRGMEGTSLVAVAGDVVQYGVTINDYWLAEDNMGLLGPARNTATYTNLATLGLKSQWYYYFTVVAYLMQEWPTDLDPGDDNEIVAEYIDWAWQKSSGYVRTYQSLPDVGGV